MMGIGVMPTEHPLYYGMVGNNGKTYANRAMNESDLDVYKRQALIAAKEVCDLPVIATLTFEADGRTLFGTDAKTAAIVLESLGASAIGANCSTGPAQMEMCIRDSIYVVDLGIYIGDLGTKRIYFLLKLCQRRILSAGGKRKCGQQSGRKGK